MDLTAKFKETLMSVLPIVVVVLILNFTIAPLGPALYKFLIGSVLLVIGLSIFLTGTEIGMVPIGEKLGSAIAQKRNVSLLLIVGFIIGFAVTFAEPDVSVLASSVHSLNPNINQRLLVFLIAVGLGLFVDIGLMRTVLGIRLRSVLFVFYALVFIAVGFAGQSMASISFDASGATTGPLAVPFLLALGLGISSSAKEGRDDSFGLTGVASIGPILAVAFMSLFSKRGSSADIASVVESNNTFISVLVSQLKNTSVGFAPLAAIIIVFQFLLLRFPRIKFRKIVFGIFYSFIGIVIFLTGVEYGFSETGRILGRTLAGNFNSWVCVIVALVFGAITVAAEPAVWVLTDQIETVSAGRIKRRHVMVFLCAGVSLSVALSMVRIIFNINYLWFVFIGVGLALVLMLFSPPLFTGMAFDSGGVASGPMSTSFLLSFALGVSGSAELGFGMVGMIAIAPLISIQVLGIIFKVNEKSGGKENALS